MILYTQDYIVAFLIVIVFLLSGIKFFMSQNLALEGGELSDLYDQIHEYKVENSGLKVQYLQGASYHTIQQKAYQMGFREGVKTWTITQAQ